MFSRLCQAHGAGMKIQGSAEKLLLLKLFHFAETDEQEESRVPGAHWKPPSPKPRYTRGNMLDYEVFWEN